MNRAGLTRADGFVGVLGQFRFRRDGHRHRELSVLTVEDGEGRRDWRGGQDSDPPGDRARRRGRGTLVEVLVAPVLFALIGAAGFSVLDQVIRVQAATDGWRLAEVQRAMHVVTQDFMQATGGSFAVADGKVSFRRTAGAGEMRGALRS